MAPLTDNRNGHGSAVNPEDSTTPAVLECHGGLEGRYTIIAATGDGDVGIDTGDGGACSISIGRAISVQLKSIRSGGRVCLPLDTAVANLLSDTVN